MKKTRCGFAVCAFILIVSCAEAEYVDKLGRSSLPDYDGVVAEQGKEVFILGNSITLHGGARKLGWEIDAGMAASDLTNDYAHQLLRLMAVTIDSAEIRNLYPIEKDHEAIDRVMLDLKEASEGARLIVLQLGDNAAVPENLGVLGQAVSSLLTLGNESTVRMCLSTFWPSKPKDAVIKKECESRGGHYVFIGDLRSYQSDGELPVFEHGGVNSHPKDKNMLRIAERINAKLIELEHHSAD